MGSRRRGSHPHVAGAGRRSPHPCRRVTTASPPPRALPAPRSSRRRQKRRAPCATIVSGGSRRGARSLRHDRPGGGRRDALPAPRSSRRRQKRRAPCAAIVPAAAEEVRADAHLRRRGANTAACGTMAGVRRPPDWRVEEKQGQQLAAARSRVRRTVRGVRTPPVNRQGPSQPSRP